MSTNYLINMYAESQKHVQYLWVVEARTRITFGIEAQLICVYSHLEITMEEHA